ncbi:cell wall-associated NlpC family hydrolase [Nonomuraea thailandensis]|uniref:Cell wall-associated NlpC family hydrolase n=1 Tax=Nonomuraea thailandensis TaxID=1188745 RepID=A0A9X2GRQ7_9ACTN|nr:NlpC/P60 family protein [Nonomuraea thailandensis]MCP2362567.1 cell wall-associated NlpC family hydrolase [Nonomuraea thailandensis]
MRRRLAVAAALLLLTATASVPLGLSMPPLIVRVAYEIEQRGIVYSWGGGHAASPGPSKGTCRGYRGRIKPCPAARTRGLDCSGFARWVYALAHGEDVLGPGNTDDHVRRMRRVSSPEPGDLVFFGKIGKRSVRTHHVGVYLGGGKMMNAPETGAVVRVDEIGRKKDFAGFYRY